MMKNKIVESISSKAGKVIGSEKNRFISKFTDRRAIVTIGLSLIYTWAMFFGQPKVREIAPPIFMAVMIAIMAFTLRKTEKANKMISAQKEELTKQKAVLEEKNKEILDSINYAKRLQEAILPPMSLIKQFFSDSFVLYKPKDIVAGDFYWMEVAHPQPFPKGKGVGGAIMKESNSYETADPTSYELLREFALKNRNNPTEPELALWELLKSKKLEGYKFRRQHIIGQYIADFVCLKKKLVIEIDGLIHQMPDVKDSDESRTLWLEHKGYSVIRFKNEEVIGYTETVLGKISAKLKSMPDIAYPQPFPKGREESHSSKVLPIGEDLGGAGTIILIAAADCTGHGVPGALVSIVCSNALNRAVKEFHITEPGKILDKVRDLVLETFERSGSNVQDGMDISLCCINIKTNEALWSGANNSLWYFRNGVLNEVNADKQPIGKNDNPKPFTTHNLQLQKGDALYFFSDGYADQFGGPKGKKFKSGQMQELLIDNSAKPMEEQRTVLERTLNSWRGNLEQVDDIIVIGIRI